MHPRKKRGFINNALPAAMWKPKRAKKPTITATNWIALLDQTKSVSSSGLTRRGEVDMWKDIKSIKPGDDKKHLLCAWTTQVDGHQWGYEVLVLWPDGVLTDTVEDEVLPGEMPDLCMEIEEYMKIERLCRDAERYRWLRQRDINTIKEGGLFAGMTPDNIVLNGAELDIAVDSFMAIEKAKSAKAT
jgi:hypothetical protein